MPAPAGGAGSSPGPPAGGAGSSPGPPAGGAGSSPGPVSERALAPPTDDARGPTDALISTAAERPEIAVGAAFAGGFVLAMILRRLAH